MSHKHYEDPILDDATEIIEDMAKEKVGIVTDCLKLNIRKEPDMDSEVVTTVSCLDELRIDLETSTNDWYAVCTAVGIEGFCMKKFVAVRQ